MSINKAILLGRVGKDPEIKDINGVKCAMFTLATGERYKDRDGNDKEDTQWHSIVAWRQAADIVERFVKKGDPLFIEGRIKYRSWENDKGEKRYATDVFADRVELLGKRESSGKPSPQPDPYIRGAQQMTMEQADDDLPF